MPKKFYKFKLLFDENMPPRQIFSRLNSRYNVKHIRDDLKIIGIPDSEVYKLTVKLKRLIVTLNGDDFKKFSATSKQAGIIALSDNLLYEHIDTKLTALFARNTQKALFGAFTSVTNET